MFVSEQVKILLERMDMHPEEFVRPYESRHLNTKWGEVLDEGTFNRVERFLIKRKFRALKRKVTQDLILATIMYEGEKEEDYVAHSTTGRFNTKRMRMFSAQQIEEAKQKAIREMLIK